MPPVSYRSKLFHAAPLNMAPPVLCSQTLLRESASHSNSNRKKAHIRWCGSILDSSKTRVSLMWFARHALCCHKDTNLYQHLKRHHKVQYDEAVQGKKIIIVAENCDIFPKLCRPNWNIFFHLHSINSHLHLTYMPPSSWGPVFSYILMRREQLYMNIPSRSLCSMFTPNIKFSSLGSFNALRETRKQQKFKVNRPHMTN